nr:[FeFe] hydrogenase H-cluster radical SAM maturase HydE [uncultured Agathobaculum sp.]
MNKSIQTLIDRLEQNHALTEAEYAALITGRTEEAAAYLAEKARHARRRVYGDQVYIRGLIEVSNICRNDCLYCGIRRSNTNCARYRLTAEQILSCCRSGYALGFRTFVLQGGEMDTHMVDAVCRVVRAIKAEFPDCAVTLSLGEYPAEAYQAMFDAGADRYLLRHETADRAHYQSLHPASMSFDNRMRCLRDLKATGYQVGCGFMVGSPGQTAQTLAKDLKFVETFAPAMCGIGPFIPHRDTPFRDKPAGSVELTLYLLSILRLIRPTLLLPATTALGTLRPDGREQGMLAGANVVMPNLSPPDAREKYTLYNGKLHSGAESAQQVAELKQRMSAIGMRVVTDRGDAAAG